MPDITTLLQETKIIAILRGVPEGKLSRTLQALYDGGIRLAEITFDATGTISACETARQIEYAAASMNGKMLIGAGTVTSKEQIYCAAQAGASFLISPHTDPELIRKTKEMGLCSIPGAMTVSEIVAAHKAGADYIKLFPASQLGPDFIRQVASPLPHIRMLAVSGVTPENIPTYLHSGAVGFGIGKDIVNSALCKSDAFDTIRDRAAQYIRACREERRQ